jgi:catechol 2,3-dioxygenase-like lactoylglutathione lyase family enzyme
MKINHLNLSVSDVPQTGRFFVEFFGLRLTEEKGRNALPFCIFRRYSCRAWSWNPTRCFYSDQSKQFKFVKALFSMVLLQFI